MSLRHLFRQAEKIIAASSPEDLKGFERICLEIQDAELELQEKARPIMTRCIHRCEGICCRNVQIDLIIGLWDFLFILVLKPHLKKQIEECLEKEEPFFSSDCVFLKDGTGPCIFPPDARPEVCLVTFCDDTSQVKKEISRIKRKFFRLMWFVLMRRPRAVAKWLMRKCKGLSNKCRISKKVEKKRIMG